LNTPPKSRGVTVNLGFITSAQSSLAIEDQKANRPERWPR